MYEQLVGPYILGMLQAGMMVVCGFSLIDLASSNPGCEVDGLCMFSPTLNPIYREFWISTNWVQNPINVIKL